MRTKILVATAIVGAVALSGVALASGGSEPAPTSVASTSTPDDSTSTSASPPANGPGIGVERAKRIALDRAGGGTVVDLEREEEHGRWVWSVRIADNGQRVRVDVDAVTGEVVRFRTDDDRDDDDARDDDRRGDDDADDHDTDDKGDRDDDRRGRGSDDGPGDDRHED